MTILTKSELRKAYEQKETPTAILSAGTIELEPILPSIMFDIYGKLGITLDIDPKNIEVDDDGNPIVDTSKYKDTLMKHYTDYEKYIACAVTKNPRILPIEKPSEDEQVITWGDLSTADKITLITASTKVVRNKSFPAKESGDGENSVD